MLPLITEAPLLNMVLNKEFHEKETRMTTLLLKISSLALNVSVSTLILLKLTFFKISSESA